MSDVISCFVEMDSATLQVRWKRQSRGYIENYPSKLCFSATGSENIEINCLNIVLLLLRLQSV